MPVMFGGLIYCLIQELITARGPENEGGKKRDEQYGKRGNSVCLGELAWLSKLKPQSSIAGVSWGRSANPPGPPLTTYFLLGGGKSLSEELACGERFDQWSQTSAQGTHNMKGWWKVGPKLRGPA